MATPAAALKQGVNSWNEWRKDKDGRSLDLSGADLAGRDLTGIDLRGVNLSNANLRQTKLGKGSLLWNANLSDADLYGANLRGADLQDVNFSGTDLHEADLRETNLQGADLSSAKGGLLSKQLAGSDLTGAKLPEPLAKLYESLSSVKEISDSAQKLFLALLVGCLYSWLTIGQTTDVELITNRATTPLPIIQAAIPIVGFYVVAPLILLCLYFYFHFYLQKLWDELGSLPAVFTDGRQLHTRTDPWLLNDLVRSHFTKLKDDRPFLSYFQAWVSVLLAWWLVPLTLFLFWGRYMRRHDLLVTIFHALLLALAIFSGVRLYRIANGTLRGKERTVFRWKDVVKRGSTYLRLLFVMILGAALITISLGAIFGEEPYASVVILSPGKSFKYLLWKAVPKAMKLLGYSPFANLANADVSVKPQNWTGKKDEELDLVKGAALQSKDLRYASADSAFLVKAQLEYADLQGASLLFADLRQADLNESNLNQASLVGARLTGSFLNGASMVEANLLSADLTGAGLVMADLTHARIFDAEIKYADFRGATGLTREEILQSKDWQLAFFSADILQQLGLPADHNEKLQKQIATEQQAKTAADKSSAPKPPQPAHNR